MGIGFCNRIWGLIYMFDKSFKFIATWLWISSDGGNWTKCYLWSFIALILYSFMIRVLLGLNFLVLKLTHETCQALFLLNILSLSLDLLGLSKYRPSSSRSSLMPQHSLGCDIIPPTKPQWSMELSRKGIGTVTWFLFYVVLSQANLNSELTYQFKKYWKDRKLGFLAIYWFYIL